MYSCSFAREWSGSFLGLFLLYWYECLLVVFACESLHVFTACIWHCEHVRFCGEVFMRHISCKFSFIHMQFKTPQNLYALHVSGFVNMQGFVCKFSCSILLVNFHSCIHSYPVQNSSKLVRAYVNARRVSGAVDM